MSIMDKVEGFEEQSNIYDKVSNGIKDTINDINGSSIKTNKKLVDNYIVVSGASGGTGASTIANNLAFTIAKRGYKVILIDLDILCPVQHSYSGIMSKNNEDLVSYLLGQNDLAKSIVSCHNFDLMYANNRSMNHLIYCSSEEVVENYNHLISKLRKLYDMVIVDTKMRIDDLLINNALFTADFIYNVWDEGLASITNTERIRKNMAECGINSYNKMKAIMNKRTNVYYRMYPFKELNIELVEILPFDTSIIENSLLAKIYCDKCASSNKNAKIFVQKINSLTDKVLSNSGLFEQGEN